MAEATERAARRKRWVGFGIAGALVVAGIVVVALVLGGPLGNKPHPAPSQPVAAGCIAPTLAPTTGSNDLRLGASAQVGTIDGHSGLALTAKGTPRTATPRSTDGRQPCTSFTISAVVRNSAPDEPRAAVSQGSDGFFSFYLGRDIVATHDSWVFKVQTAAESGKAIQALSTTPATVGQWTTLTGVYDVKAQTISLYVDGVLAKTTRRRGSCRPTARSRSAGRASSRTGSTRGTARSPTSRCGTSRWARTRSPRWPRPGRRTCRRGRPGSGSEALARAVARMAAACGHL